MMNANSAVIPKNIKKPHKIVLADRKLCDIVKVSKVVNVN